MEREAPKTRMPEHEISQTSVSQIFPKQKVMAHTEAFAYLRVSTRRQDSENQRMQIGKYAEARGITIKEYDWYTDDAVSGSIPPMQRPAFKDMMDYLEDLKAKDPSNLPTHVFVYEVSRLGRNLWEVLEAIKMIEKYSTLISTSPKESFWSIEDGSIRNLIILIVSWAADREREMLIQRVHEGVDRAKEEKRHFGNVPLGYDIHRCKVGVCIETPGEQCEEHGRLFLTVDGRAVLEMLKVNANLRPRDLKSAVSPSLETNYQLFALLRNVKKFGETN